MTWCHLPIRNPLYTIAQNEVAYKAAAWFDRWWPFVGLAFPVALIVMILMDPAKFAMAGHSGPQRKYGALRLATYLPLAIFAFHQFEEYGMNMDGHKHSFRLWMIHHLGWHWAPRFITVMNVGTIWGFMCLGISYFEATANPLIPIVMNLMCVSQVSHIFWWYQFDFKYNPGLLQSVFMNVPVGIYCVGLIIRVHYDESFENILKIFAVAVPLAAINQYVMFNPFICDHAGYLSMGIMLSAAVTFGLAEWCRQDNWLKVKGIPYKKL